MKGKPWHYNDDIYLLSTNDNMETIKKRIETYENQTIPVIQFYHKQGKHVKIEGVGTIQEIFDRVSTAIDSVK